MLGREVILYAGGRLEGHGAAGAFVEHIAMSLLDVGLYRVESAEHHETTGTSTERTATGESGQRGFVGNSVGVHCNLLNGHMGKHHTCIRCGA